MVLPQMLDASTNIIDMGRAYAGIFVDTYAMTIAGTAIIIMMPAKSGTVLMVLNINPAVPNANDIESMTKTVAAVYERMSYT